jgi:hypothetical protein
MKIKTSNLLLISLSILAFTLTLGFWWSKQAYLYPDAVKVSRQFMQHLRNEDYAEAYMLTSKPNLMGGNLQEFTRYAQRECLDDKIFDYASPPQTNGNRLRRWLKGRGLDQAKINLDFTGSCLLRVQMNQNAQQEWRVLTFASHAG